MKKQPYWNNPIIGKEIIAESTGFSVVEMKHCYESNWIILQTYGRYP